MTRLYRIILVLVLLLIVTFILLTADSKTVTDFAPALLYLGVILVIVTILFEKKLTITHMVSIASVIIGLVGLIIAIQALDLAIYQIEYPILDVSHHINEEKELLILSIKNNASRKETGTIYFYRLEISDSRPHHPIDSLKPGESINWTFPINIDEANYTIRGKCKPGALQSQVPAGKLFYVMDTISISYKLTCDNCYTQGVIRRMPEFRMIDTAFKLDSDTQEKCFNGSITNFNATGTVPIYSWLSFDLDDL